MRISSIHEVSEPWDGEGELHSFSGGERREEVKEAVTEDAWGERLCFLAQLLGEDLDWLGRMRVLGGMVRKAVERKKKKR